MDAARYFRLVLEQKKLLCSLNLHSVLEEWFAKFLVVHPLNEKDLKVWEKINANQKLGFLSRKIIKAAKKLKIPNAYIESYIESKNMYKFYKNRSQTLDTKKIQNSDNQSDVFSEIYQYGKSKGYTQYRVQHLFSHTIIFIKIILELSTNEIKQLLNTHD